MPSSSVLTKEIERKEKQASQSEEKLSLESSLFSLQAQATVSFCSKIHQKKEQKKRRNRVIFETKTKRTNQNKTKTKNPNKQNEKKTHKKKWTRRTNFEKKTKENSLKNQFLF